MDCVGGMGKVITNWLEKKNSVRHFKTRKIRDLFKNGWLSFQKNLGRRRKKIRLTIAYIRKEMYIEAYVSLEDTRSLSGDIIAWVRASSSPEGEKGAKMGPPPPSETRRHGRD